VENKLVNNKQVVSSWQSDRLTRADWGESVWMCWGWVLGRAVWV